MVNDMNRPLGQKTLTQEHRMDDANRANRNRANRAYPLAWVSCFLTVSVATFCDIAATPVCADDQRPVVPHTSAMTPGLSVEQLAKQRGVLFAHELKDVPGKNLVVVKLTFSPSAQKSARCTAHSHPGSVWVYVTQGTARLGVAGEPVQVVHTGESFYEPKGAVHTVAESASATEPASAIAVMIVPDGAPLLTPAPCEKP
jgi:quercetin dioxygenase-like cupin family protein